MSKKHLVVSIALALAFLSSAVAQTRVVILGTQGGPRPSAQRSAPANAVVVGDRIYLVDAGNGVARQLAAAGLDLRRVERIFITHNHDDHNADWGTLMGLKWTLGPSSDTHVHGPVGTQAMLQGYLQYFAPNTRIRDADSKKARTPQDSFHAHDIEASGPVFEDNRVTVTAMENCHYHDEPGLPPHGADKSFALRIQTPDKVVVFSGDSGRCPGLAAFARGADLLLNEVIALPLMAQRLQRTYPPQVVDGLVRHMAEDHMAPEDIGRLARDAGVKQVVLTHVAPGGDEPDDTYTEGVRKYYLGPVVVARDLMAF